MVNLIRKPWTVQRGKSTMGRIQREEDPAWIVTRRQTSFWGGWLTDEVKRETSHQNLKKDS